MGAFNNTDLALHRKAANFLSVQRLILKHSTEPSPEAGLQMPILRRGGEEEEKWTTRDNSSTPQLPQLRRQEGLTEEGPRTPLFTQQHWMEAPPAPVTKGKAPWCPHLSFPRNHPSSNPA